MKNFTYYVPTKIHFGKGMISHAFENYFSPIKDAFMVEKTAGLQTRLFRSRRRTCWRSSRIACEYLFAILQALYNQIYRTKQ